MSTDHTSQPDTVSLSHALTVLLRRWRTVVVCTVLGVLLAGAAYVMTPPSYQATAQVLVSPLPVALSATATGAQSVTAKDVSMATEVGVVTSSSVAKTVATGMVYQGNPDDLLANVDVQNPTDSLLLLITYTAKSAQGAADGANAFASAYLAQRADAAATAEKELQDEIAKQLTSLQAQVDTLNKQIPTESTTAASADVQKRTALISQMDSLTALSGKVRLLDLTPGEPVGTAVAPTSPSAPRRNVYLVIGLLLGFLVGCLLAALRESRDKTVHSYVDLEGITGERVLGRVPGGSARQVEEAYRQIAVHLRAGAPDVTPFLLAVTGPHDEALSAVPALVSRGVAAIGSTVLLATVGHSSASLPAGKSVSTTDLGPEAQFATRSASPDLGLLGKSPSQVVVLDGVNVEQESTALVLAEASAGVVVAVAQDRTSRSELAALLETLRQVGTPILGLVVVEKGSSGPTAPVKELDQPVSVAAALESARVPSVRS